VIELSGLPATNLKAYKALMLKLFTHKQIDDILEARINFIRAKILECRPELVVMYGLDAKKQ
jgi:hypothetical protein